MTIKNVDFHVLPVEQHLYFSAKASHLTIRESQHIIDHIQQRAFYVFDRLAKIYCREYSWVGFDTSNLEQDFDVGVYDYERYLNQFSFHSDLDDSEYRHAPVTFHFNTFPAKFIYEEFEQDLIAEFDEFKSKIDQKREKSKQKRERDKQNKAARDKIRPAIIKSITAKLTPEELSFIEFK